MDASTEASKGFDQTGLSSEILSILNKEGLTVPTPIQAQSIPVALKGGDLIGIAQTGTGKTLAFSLPLIQRLRNNPNELALIIVPTRELALQVEESVRRITRSLPDIKTISLIGGMPMYRQIQGFRMRPRILIATPGRLNDHLERKTLYLDRVGIIVLDEADRMLDMGFAPQIEGIMNSLPEKHQTLMFSATMAPEVTRLVHQYTNNPARVEIAKAGTSNHLVRQEVAYVAPARKTELLTTLLGKHEGPVLVFTRTKLGARDLMQEMKSSGHPAAEIHGDRSLRERREALDGFKAGKYRVLIATDIAARGIDVPNISLVVNYDLPDATDDYVHRIGRTGRAGNAGLAITFATRYQVRTIKTIEGLVKKQMIVSEHSEPIQHQSQGRERSRFSNGGRSGGYQGRRPSFGSFNNSGSGRGEFRRRPSSNQRSRSY